MTEDTAVLTHVIEVVIATETEETSAVITDLAESHVKRVAKTTTPDLVRHRTIVVTDDALANAIMRRE